MPVQQNFQSRGTERFWPKGAVMCRLVRRGVVLIGAAVAISAFGPALAEESLAPVGKAVGSASQSGVIAQQPTSWRVMVVTGADRYRVPGQEHGAWQSLYPGLLLGAGAQIETGADGQVELTNGRDRIVIGSSSNIGLPDASLDPQIVTILQNTGSVHYEVQTRRKTTPQPKDLMSRIRGALFGRKGPKERFEVRTPHLVAIVKGTAFDVSVEPHRAEVSVTEGVVSISNNSGGDSADVGVGETAAAEASSSSTGGTSSGNTGGTSGTGGGKGSKKDKSGKKDKGGKGKGKGGGNGGGKK